MADPPTFKKNGKCVRKKRVSGVYKCAAVEGELPFAHPHCSDITVCLPENLNPIRGHTAQNSLFIRRINDTTVKTRSMKSETS